MKNFLMVTFLFTMTFSFKSFGKELLANKTNQSIGGSVGAIWGVVYQMPYRDNNALAITAGYGPHQFLVLGDILWYQPQFTQWEGFLPYIGTGAGIGTDKNSFGSDTGVVLRAPIGGTYHLKGKSIDFYGHLAPQLDTTGASYINLQLGLHYIF